MNIQSMTEPSFLAKKIVFWFLVNSVLGTVIAFLQSAWSPFPFWNIFITSQITTHIISMLSSISGHIAGKIFFNDRVALHLLLVLPWTFAASMAGYFISRRITHGIMGIYPFPGAGEIHGPVIGAVLFITLIITSISIIFQRLTRSRNELLDRVGTGRAGGRNEASLAVRERDNHFVIDYGDIIYLSSHGKRTLIHTEEKDYETPQLMKDIEERLDRDIFIRIHKQFIVNVSYVSKIQYYRGGRYMAYLKDSDETMLPVGKNATSLLKKRLGM